MYDQSNERDRNMPPCRGSGMMKYSHNIKAAIVPIAGLSLSVVEYKLFQEMSPLGYIIFSRNYRDPAQLKQLIDSLKECSGREDILVLIDQEGQRVARLREPFFTVLKNAQEYGIDAQNNLPEAVKRLHNDFRLVGAELRDIGINVDCAPVADLYQEHAHTVIGVRSYGSDVNMVTALCRAADSGLAESKVQSIIKHIPGHGRAKSDTHLTLPVIYSDLQELQEHDFKVFHQLHDMKMAMTAHIVFHQIDEMLPATLSPKVVAYIRNQIGFKGLLITDALEMKAIKGTPEEIVKQASIAGCDIMLYCNPDIAKVRDILRYAPTIEQNIGQLSVLNCFI